MTNSDATKLQKEKPCWACNEPIQSKQKFCTNCDNWQNWRSYTAFSSSILALLIALFSVTSTTLPVLYKYLAPKKLLVEMGGKIVTRCAKQQVCNGEDQDPSKYTTFLLSFENFGNRDLKFGKFMICNNGHVGEFTREPESGTFFSKGFFADQSTFIKQGKKLEIEYVHRTEQDGNKFAEFSGYVMCMFSIENFVGTYYVFHINKKLGILPSGIKTLDRDDFSEKELLEALKKV